MIASWMLYALAVGGLVTIAALALDHALAARGRATRWVWTTAIALSIAIPILGAIPRDVFMRSRGREMVPFTITVAAPDAIVVTTGSTSRAVIVNRALFTLWAAACLLLFVRLARATRSLGRMRRSWRPGEVDGVPVQLSADVGPAVIGLGPMHVVLPEWILALDRPHRALVLRHEQEHRAARDPYLLFGSAVAVALMPWNPALWIQSERLRLAIEMDCDARVLRAHPTPERYGLLMLTIAQRRSVAPALFAPMLSEPTTHLERRIVAMRASTHRFTRLSTYAATVFSAALLVLAGSLRSAGATVRSRVTDFDAKPAAEPDAGSARRQEGNPGPRYPDILRQGDIEGTVIAEFTSDANGVPDVSTIRIVASSHDLFAAAVRNVLPRWHVAPNTTMRIPFMFVMADKSGQALTSVPPNAVVVTGNPVRAAPVARRPHVQTANAVVVTTVPPASADTAAVNAARRGSRASDSATATSAAAGTPAGGEAGPRKVSPGETMFEFQVERPASPMPGNPAPRYPDLLRAAKIEGEVLAQFVVDTLGQPDMRSFKVLKSTHDLFTEAVRNSLPNMRFYPAEVGGRKVKQLLQMPFEFNLTRD
jgi:TonB family protein